MLKWLRDLLWGGTDAEFMSAFGLDESVRRLSEGIRRSAFFVFTASTTVGNVTPSRVTLQRVRPFFRNDFKPIFEGQFVEANGRVYLRGTFRISTYTRAFLALWLAFCLTWTFLAAVGSLTNPAMWWFPFLGIGMFALGIGFAAAARSTSRGDIEWLSEIIRGRLHGVT